jgi:flagellin
MSLVINTNIGSLNAQRSLAASGAELKTAMERLSSGSKINSASDDAAGFAIAERMTAQIRGLNMAAKNAGDGLSMLAAIENATNDVTDMLQRMRELAVQAVNDTNTQQDREYLQGEVSALIAEIDRVATQTQYNGQAILDGSMGGKIQVGTEANQTVEFSINSIATTALGLTSSTSLTDIGMTADHTYDYINPADHPGSTHWGVGTTEVKDLDTSDTSEGIDFSEFNVGDLVAFGSDTSTHYAISETEWGPGVGNHPGIAWIHVDGDATGVSGAIYKVETSDSSNIDLVNDASGALAAISNAIEQVAGDRAGYGALQNRLEYTVSNLMNVSEFTTAARSRIADADFAAESARLAKAQVLQQSGTAMLAQANASSQLALSLIR